MSLQVLLEDRNGTMSRMAGYLDLLSKQAAGIKFYSTILFINAGIVSLPSVLRTLLQKSIDQIILISNPSRVNFTSASGVYTNIYATVYARAYTNICRVYTNICTSVYTCVYTWLQYSIYTRCIFVL